MRNASSFIYEDITTYINLFQKNDRKQKAPIKQMLTGASFMN